MSSTRSLQALREWAMPLYTGYHRLRSRGRLRRLIEGRRVLVVGTGPSAADLDSIPPDVLVFTCKLGIRLFAERHRGRHVDLYTCFRSSLEKQAEMPHYFRRTHPRFFLTNDLRYVRSRADLVFTHLLHDNGSDNSMLAHLIKPLHPEDIRGNARRGKTSSGVRLLQYALTFGSAEVYLIGIDLGRNGYVGGDGDLHKPWNHHDIDENFLRLVGAQQGNVFSLSPRSPAARFLPHARLT